MHAMQVFGRRRQLKHSHSAPWEDRNGILSLIWSGGLSQPTAKLVTQFQRTRLMTPSTDKHFHLTSLWPGSRLGSRSASVVATSAEIREENMKNVAYKRPGRIARRVRDTRKCSSDLFTHYYAPNRFAHELACRCSRKWLNDEPSGGLSFCSKDDF